MLQKLMGSSDPFQLLSGVQSLVVLQSQSVLQGQFAGTVVNLWMPADYMKAVP